MLELDLNLSGILVYCLFPSLPVSYRAQSFYVVSEFKHEPFSGRRLPFLLTDPCLEFSGKPLRPVVGGGVLVRVVFVVRQQWECRAVASALGRKESDSKGTPLHNRGGCQCALLFIQLCAKF